MNSAPKGLLRQNDLLLFNVRLMDGKVNQSATVPQMGYKRWFDYSLTRSEAPYLDKEEN